LYNQPYNQLSYLSTFLRKKIKLDLTGEESFWNNSYAILIIFLGFTRMFLF